MINCSDWAPFWTQISLEIFLKLFKGGWWMLLYFQLQCVDVSHGQGKEKKEEDWQFWNVVLKRMLKIPWIARRTNKSMVKEIRPPSYFGHMCAESERLEKSNMREEEDEVDLVWLNRWSKARASGSSAGQRYLEKSDHECHQKSDTTTRNSTTH